MQINALICINIFAAAQKISLARNLLVATTHPCESTVRPRCFEVREHTARRKHGVRRRRGAPDNKKHRRETRMETFYEVMRRQGISRRSFLKYCSLTATSLGLGPAFVPQIAHAMETKPRTPVLWLHGLECTCCSESFIRSAHPLAKDVVLSMISLDYDDTLMAAAGHQAEAILEEIMTKYKGNYILAVEGNPPLNQDGMSCIIGGKPFIDQLKHVAKDAKAIISWGSCASWGCVQAAKPNPTQATPVHKVIFDKPIIKVPGCPPIAEALIYGLIQLQNKIRRTSTIAR